MWIWLVTAAAAGIAAGGTISIWIERKQRRREMETLLELTELVLEEKEVTNRTAGEETIYAKIEDRLIRICRMAKGRQEEAEKAGKNFRNLLRKLPISFGLPWQISKAIWNLQKGKQKEEMKRHISISSRQRELKRKSGFSQKVSSKCHDWKMT